MSNIKLYYWNGLNFGDEISPYIIEKLTGNIPIYRKTTFKGFLHQLIDSIIKERNVILFAKLLKSFFSPGRIILGAGSVANISNYKTITWGAGFMIPDSKVKSGKFVAVRGKLSGEIIMKKSLAKKLVYGDPGILLPLVYPKVLEKKNIGIVPHIKDYKYFVDNYQNKYKIINLANKDVESVINQILECKYILSSSLHGIIVAHAYGIPAIWIEKTVLEESGFKFYDYFSSVDIPKYRGFNDLENLFRSKENTINFFNQNKRISLPCVDIRELQRGLIECVPFKVLSKYRIKKQ